MERPTSGLPLYLFDGVRVHVQKMGSQMLETIFQLIPGQGDESGLPALIWATKEIASNKIQPLVGLTNNGGYMLGPTQIVCEGNTYVHSIRHCL